MGVSVLTGGTDVHLALVDLRASSSRLGRAGEDRLHDVGITVNRNAVPFDPRPPMVTSGLRIGTPALATRGFGAPTSARSDLIAATLLAGDFARQMPVAGRAGSAGDRGALPAYESLPAVP